MKTLAVQFDTDNGTASETSWSVPIRYRAPFRPTARSYVGKNGRRNANRTAASWATQDRQALADFYDQVAGVLFATAIRILGDSQEAEEVIQDVFVQIWEKAPMFDIALGTPFHWAVSITRTVRLTGSGPASGEPVRLRN